MNGFLVLLSCTMDDFPIALVDNEDEATGIAMRQTEAVSERIQDMFGIDATEGVCVKIVLFANGIPVGVKTIKGFGWWAN